MKKTFLLYLLGLLFSVQLYAIEYEGLRYEIYGSVACVTGVLNISDDVVIPSELIGSSTNYPVVSIAKSAFSGCYDVTSVTIPNSVTSIGDGAFYGCSNLRSVVIPNSVTSMGNMVFQNCNNLTSATLPNSITSIGYQTFLNCSSLAEITIPNSVTSIESGAFYGCSKLSNVRMGNSVTWIDYSVFAGCSSLTEMIIPSSVTSIESSTFSNCYNLTTIIIPNSVTSIGNSAFYNCASLTNISIPNSVTSIGSSAFYGCRKLTSITIPNSVTSIRDQAFSNCSGLASISLPNSTTSIGIYAFNGCWNLASITIPNSVSSIGERAFGNCDKLTAITIPSSVVSIGELAFYDCESLVSIKVDKDNPNYTSLDGVLFNKGKSELICYPIDKKSSFYVVPNSVASINPYAFAGCTNLTSIDLPATLTSIGGSAFSECSDLTSMTIPASASSISKSALKGCYRLKKIHVQSATPLKVDAALFAYVNKINCILYVPMGCKTKYEEAENWRDFNNIVEEENGDQEVMYSIRVTANEGGRSFANGTEIQDGFVSMPEKEKVEVSIAPTEGYRIKSVVLNNNDITSQMTDGKYRVASLSEHLSFEVVFEKNPFYLLLSHADNGTLNMQVTEGEIYRFNLVPQEGWRIHTVMFNDEEVTDQLNNGLFVTPAIEKNSTLMVSFESISSPVFETVASRIVVFGRDSEIIVKGGNIGDVVKIYSESGALIASSRVESDEMRIRVASGIYIVGVGGRTFKVAL